MSRLAPHAGSVSSSPTSPGPHARRALEVEGRATLEVRAGSFSLTSNTVRRNGRLEPAGAAVPDERPFGVELGRRSEDRRFQDRLCRALHAARRTGPPAEVKADGALRINGEFQLTNESIRVPEYHFRNRAARRSISSPARRRSTPARPAVLLDRRRPADRCQPSSAFRAAAAKTGRDPAVSLRQRSTQCWPIAADIRFPQVPDAASLKNFRDRDRRHDGRRRSP